MSRKKLVVLTGAGISAESGLKTFRDSDGLWEGYRVEEVATPEAWRKNPAMVLDFYNYRRREILKAQPNEAHLGLASLQDHFDMWVVTQNIDDLHERAGSRRVLHLHGEIFRMCSSGDRRLRREIRTDMQPGARAEDGHPWRPDIVWFGESVPMISEAVRLTQEADLFVVVGTSLQVYPAAGLIHATPPHAQRYIIDRKIPDLTDVSLLTAIEMPATKGVRRLQEILLS